MWRITRLTPFESSPYDCPYERVLHWLCGGSRAASRPRQTDLRSDSEQVAPSDSGADGRGSQARNKSPFSCPASQ
jgi:hypothetical protein